MDKKDNCCGLDGCCCKEGPRRHCRPCIASILAVIAVAAFAIAVNS